MRELFPSDTPVVAVSLKNDRLKQCLKALVQDKVYDIGATTRVLSLAVGTHCGLGLIHQIG